MPMPPTHGPDGVRFQPETLEHYHRAGPLIEATFGGEPIVYANFPQDFAGKPHFVITDVPLSTAKLMWLVHRAHAVEFQSWAPLATDEDRLRFARIIVTRPLHDEFTRIREGAERLRRQLHLDDLDAAIVQDGHNGLALRIPLADAPHAAVARAWLHKFCDRAVADAPRPLVAAPDLESLDSATRGHVITATIAILQDGKARTADQILDEALARKLVPPTTTKKYIYSALIEYIARWLGRGRKPQIVQDNERKFRINEPPDDWPDLVPFPAPAPDEAVDALVARLESTSTGNDPAAFEIACCDVFAHLGFRTQHLGGHANPDGIADAQLGPLAFRVMLECKSAPVHSKPSRPHGGGIVIKPDVAEAAKFVTAFDADFAVLLGPDFENEIELLNELKTHKVTAFTVSDLSTLLHVRANPLGVRTVLEPGFAMEAIADLVWERRHGRVKRIATVAALVRREGWLAQCAAADQDIYGGSAQTDAAHASGNGHPESDGAQSEINAQQSADGNGRLNRGDAPRLTIDAAMLLVDQALRAAGSTQACTREEVEAAFTHLTDPLVGSAAWLAPSHDAIAILSPGSICTDAIMT